MYPCVQDACALANMNDLGMALSTSLGKVFISVTGLHVEKDDHSDQEPSTTTLKPVSSVVKINIVVFFPFMIFY